MTNVENPAAEKVKIQSFTDLYAWQEAHKLVLMVYKITNHFPKNEQYGLVSQLQRAVVSITSNIAEGFKRRTKNDKRKFYTTSLASLTEVENQLIITHDIQYAPATLVQEAQQQAVIVGKLTNGLRRSAMTFHT